MKIVLWSILMFSLCCGAQAQKAEPVKDGDLFPPLEFQTTKGKTVTMGKFKGKYVYIDIWASWCAPCLQQMPALKKLEEQFKDKQIVFVGLSDDSEVEGWKVAVDFLKLEGHQLYYRNDDVRKQFAGLFQLSSIPRFILLDKTGRIINQNMTRPSDPETAVALSALKNI